MPAYEILNAEQAQEATKKEYPLWEKGEYNFGILDEVTLGASKLITEEFTSSTGNPCWKIVVKVFAKDGSDNTKYIIDYVNLTGKTTYKLRHLASATGNLDKYESGTLDVKDLFHKGGKCILGSSKESTNKQTGQIYKAKNVIDDYVQKDQPKVTIDEDLNDEIPWA